MPSNKLLEALSRYEVSLRSRGFEPERASTSSVSPTPEQALSHALWMCGEIRKHFEEGNPDKAMRWMCFVQGILWMTGFDSIDAFREDNAHYGDPVNASG